MKKADWRGTMYKLALTCFYNCLQINRSSDSVMHTRRVVIGPIFSIVPAEASLIKGRQFGSTDAEKLQKCVMFFFFSFFFQSSGILKGLVPTIPPLFFFLFFSLIRQLDLARVKRRFFFLECAGCLHVMCITSSPLQRAACPSYKRGQAAHCGQRHHDFTVLHFSEVLPTQSLTKGWFNLTL